MKKKIKLSKLDVQSFNTGLKGGADPDQYTHGLTNCFGFTCDAMDGCGDIFTVWVGNGNICGPPAY